MTLIVGSLLLPHTVSFDNDASTSEPDRFEPSESSAPIPINPQNGRNAKSASTSPNAAMTSLASGSGGGLNVIPDIVNNLTSVLQVSTPAASGNATPSAGQSPSDGFFSKPNPIGPSPRPGLTRTLTTPDTASPPPSNMTSGLRKLALQPQSRAQTPVSSNILNTERPHASQQPKHQQLPQKHDKALFEEKLDFNETPWNIQVQHGGNGGLKNAINRASRDGRIDKVTWVGTVGLPTDELDDKVRKEIEHELVDGYDNVPVFVDDTTYEGHYNHYCKQILWPTLHYQVPDNPKNKAYEDHSWHHYKRLNELFADKICKVYKKGDVVWINDYHLLLVPEMVRKRIPDAKIGLFLHVAFPSSEVFRCLACRRELLEGMMGANCVGFQISEYSRHFLQTCNRLMAVDTTPYGIRAEGKFVSVVNLVIGIDPESLNEQLAHDSVKEWRRQIRERWPTQKLIVSRDKLDHIRGIKQKLLAYEAFLKANPSYIEKAVLIQVCLSDITDPQLDADLSAVVDRINAMCTDLAGTTPVVLLQQDIDFSTYLALLCEADAFAVASLREGMNLTCYEFVYCNKDKMGPLILSEFIGAASVLGKHSLLINPWDKGQVAQEFANALTMDKEKKQANFEELYELVSTSTGGDWAAQFVKYLESSWQDEQLRKVNSLHRLDLAKFEAAFLRATKRVFFLNLDSGEMVPEKPSLNESGGSGGSGGGGGCANTLKYILNKNPHYKLIPGNGATMTSYVSPQRKISVLTELVTDPSNIVYVISSDSRALLERTFRRVQIGLIAEDGAFVRPFGSDEWVSYIDEERCKQWKKTVAPMLESFNERLPGSWVQYNESSIYFHVNSIAIEDHERLHSSIGECINHINDGFRNEKIRARLHGGKIVIYDQSIAKLNAVTDVWERLTQEQQGIDYLCLASEGADVATEEDDQLFKWANCQKNVHVCTLAIGSNGTLATWAIEGVNGLLNALLAASRRAQYPLS